MPKHLPTPLGRWRNESCSIQLNNKIDLSNEDHCGPCGQYALEKREIIKYVNKNHIPPKIDLHNDNNNK